MNVTDEERKYLAQLSESGLIVGVVGRQRDHLYAYVTEESVRHDDPSNVPPGVRVYVLPPHDVVKLGERPCGACGMAAESFEAPDGCLGRLNGVTSACCGHGGVRHPYACFEGGGGVAGEEALKHLRERSACPPAPVTG